MTTFKIFRETTLPGTLQPYAIYLIAPASKPNFVEIYVSDSTGAAAKRVLNESDIQALIDASASSSSSLTIVDNIAARNALTPTSNIQVFVINATGDPTVNSGGATYIYRVSTTSWIKISEAESLDLSLTWASLSGKPTSNVSDIDNAVALRHSHSNKTELDKIGENGNGNFTYNGSLPLIDWSSIGW
jgi:TUP1-like enhancer of split